MAAKETIALAEERLLEEDSRQFDSAWQEMLNHATNRVLMELYLGLSKNIILLQSWVTLGPGKPQCVLMLIRHH